MIVISFQDSPLKKQIISIKNCSFKVVQPSLLLHCSSQYIQLFGCGLSYKVFYLPILLRRAIFSKIFYCHEMSVCTGGIDVTIAQLCIWWYTLDNSSATSKNCYSAWKHCASFLVKAYTTILLFLFLITSHCVSILGFFQF